MALTQPEAKEIKLGPGTYFPVQHSVAMLERARKGERVFTADLYDGSEKGEKIYATSAFIGPRKPPGHNKAMGPVEGAERLDGLSSWPISISYFDPGSEKKDATPVYELSFVYFENGVSRRLNIDYGDFALKGDLVSITFLEPGKCDKKR
jgi:hypothetical protein